ncbi:hypothetical protein MgSA37_03141 [Mucilaginibacter gotjawali]|uniref:Uncharacterized protein n=2 Tax=Mucilaginibacter gotjawali TaxID=1550579 RepID=A0A0X8X3I0_9SPHI|nr:hypothetical protein [Mucilaginibacter gotjawali]BAU54961.1 hypothetical protein MgSA37_03141 [Mucilaginibacter gotjawali]
MQHPYKEAYHSVYEYPYLSELVLETKIGS